MKIYCESCGKNFREEVVSYVNATHCDKCGGKLIFDHQNGVYDLEGVIWHQHSPRLLKKIMELWPEKHIPIVDLGCGHNFYANVLKLDYRSAIGIDLVAMKGVDYLADVTNLQIKKSESTIVKFEKSEINKEAEVHWHQARILSLEVGEHIPYEKCFTYLNNLTSFGGDIIMSWAVPGQAGHGHINCQDNRWVEKNMLNRKYRLDHDLTEQLRESVKDCHCSWFKNTLMYYRPIEK